MTSLQEHDVRAYIEELQLDGHADAAAWLATLLETQCTHQPDVDA